MRSKIDKIYINNFKFFDEGKSISLNGKHLLLYGENGSGKSSVYWALHTLFECAFKNDSEITKYFKPISEDPVSLVNIYAAPTDNGAGINHCNSYIKITTNEKDPVDYEVSLFNTSINSNPDAIEINKGSDFINYKVLYKFQDFVNGEKINLTSIFRSSVLPYVKFNEIITKYENVDIRLSNGLEMFLHIQKGIEKIDDSIKGAKQAKIQATEFYIAVCKNFEQSFDELIDFINVNAPTLLLKLGYNIGFKLVYDKSTPFKFPNGNYSFNIEFQITSYLGKPITIERPQSFLNEAKITAIALAIRLTILNKRVTTEAPDLLKFIVFDDVMISLDMNNRDKFIDYLLNKENKYIEDYQILFLTHDKNLFDFVSHKIKKWDNVNNWVFKELYNGADDKLNKEYPVIIDSEIEFIDKAQKYFDAKDYTASSIYLRKELEKVVNERLPPTLKLKTDGTFLTLQTLWNNMVSRYDTLGKPLADDLKKEFNETKLLVLNPQAHFQELSMPVYKVELEKTFSLIKKIKDNYPIPVRTVLLTKGTELKFKHPSINYSIYFNLISDFSVENLDGQNNVFIAKCEVIKWNYLEYPFWNFEKGTSEPLSKALELRLDQIRNTLLNPILTPLNIDNDMFINHVYIKDSIWTFKDIIEKANVTF